VSEPIDLKRRREQKERDAEAQRAALNRAKHGLSKAERARLAHETAERDRLLDGHRLDADAEGTPDAE
jgi:hypothetical protein